MNLKEFIEANKKILYASICIADCSYIPEPSIACNVNKMSDGNYHLENPEITLEELSDIDIKDIEKFEMKSFYDSEYGKCEYMVIEISEETILNNPDKILYKKLSQKLNKDYEKLTKKYTNLEQEYQKPFYNNNGITFFKEISGPFIIFAIIALILAWRFTNITENKERIISLVTAIIGLLIGTIVLFIQSYLENKKEEKHCKEAKEKYIKKLNMIGEK